MVHGHVSGVIFLPTVMGWGRNIHQRTSVGAVLGFPVLITNMPRLPRPYTFGWVGFGVKWPLCGQGRGRDAFQLVERPSDVWILLFIPIAYKDIGLVNGVR